MNLEKKEVPNFRPDHYTSQPYSVETVQIEISYNLFKSLTAKGVPEKEAFSRGVWASFALKHLCRLGLKDDVDLELRKAENYTHKARTEEWLND